MNWTATGCLPEKNRAITTSTAKIASPARIGRASNIPMPKRSRPVPIDVEFGSDDSTIACTHYFPLPRPTPELIACTNQIEPLRIRVSA
jgi:hypothetical protein